jgi:hypothetical protein
LPQTNTHKFYWTVNPQQVVPAADTPYIDANLALSLYSGLLSLTPTLEATKTITFRARMDSSVDISLVESGKRFDISETTQLIDSARWKAASNAASTWWCAATTATS